MLCAVSPAAFADGMPFKEKKPAPAATSLDKALDDIQNKEPPVSVAQPAPPPPAPPPAPAPAPAPAAAPAPAPAPVPEARVVEVQPDASFFGLSVGMYDPFTHSEKAASLGFEFQPGVKIAGVLQPLFGGLVTTNGALLGYGGVGVPLHLNDHWMITPSIAIGAYKQGDGVDLERTIVYRAGAELAYVFENKSRIGLNFHVITNGKSTGPEDRTEVIGLAYTTPFELLSGGPKTTAPDPEKKK
jgi:hypothetical protein